MKRLGLLALALALALSLLTSCAYNHVGELNHPGNSNFLIAAQPNGQPAVTLYEINRIKSGIMYFDEASVAMSLPPGAYKVALNCLRPNSMWILDGNYWFEFTIKASGSYVLDCSPVPGLNNFSLKNGP